MVIDSLRNRAHIGQTATLVVGFCRYWRFRAKKNGGGRWAQAVYVSYAQTGGYVAKDWTSVTNVERATQSLAQT